MSLSYALLGILKMSPMSGYDLNKFFNDSINFFWSAQMSQIYRELKSLEEKGMLTVVEETGTKGPNKKVYSITELGIKQLEQWLRNVPDKIDEDNHNVFLLRVMLLGDLGAEALYEQIKIRLQKYKDDLNELYEVEKRIPYYLQQTGRLEQKPFLEITLKRGLSDVSAHIQWAEEALIELSKLIENKI